MSDQNQAKLLVHYMEGFNDCREIFKNFAKDGDQLLYKEMLFQLMRKVDFYGQDKSKEVNNGKN